jgi:hypothetical protein
MVNQKQPSDTWRSVEDIGPLEILKRIGAVAYGLALPPSINSIINYVICK